MSLKSRELKYKGKSPLMYKQYFISYISNKDTRVKTVIL